MNKISLAPAERAEILVDFSNYSVGDKITLRDNDNNLMTINIVGKSNKNIDIPKNLVKIINYDRDKIVHKRQFVMSGMGSMVTINGKQMDMNRIDEKLNLTKIRKKGLFMYHCHILEHEDLGMMGQFLVE